MMNQDNKTVVETIHNLMHLVRELYPDDPETQEMLDIDAVMLQANVVVDNLTKEKANIEAEANEAFYKWEEKLFPQGIESNLSDNDRNLFVTGYVIAILTKEKTNV